MPPRKKILFLRGFEEQTQVDFIDLVSKALLGASQCPTSTVVGDLCASFCEHFFRHFDLSLH